MIIETRCPRCEAYVCGEEDSDAVEAWLTCEKCGEYFCEDLVGDACAWIGEVRNDG